MKSCGAKNILLNTQGLWTRWNGCWLLVRRWLDNGQLPTLLSGPDDRLSITSCLATAIQLLLLERPRRCFCVVVTPQTAAQLWRMWLKSFSPVVDWRSTSTERCHRITILFRSDSAARVTTSLLSFCYCPQCVDAAGFCLFLKTYLEAEDFPSDFYHRLYRYFQHSEQEESSQRGTWVPPALMLHTTQSHAVSTSLSFRRRLSSWRVLLLLRAGGRTTARQARVWVSSPSCIVHVWFITCTVGWQNVITISLLRLHLKTFQVKKNEPLPVFDLPVVTFKLYDKDGNGLLDSAVSVYILCSLCFSFFCCIIRHSQFCQSFALCYVLSSFVSTRKWIV